MVRVNSVVNCSNEPTWLLHLYQPGFRQQVEGEDSYEIVTQAGKQAEGLDQALAADIETYLPDDLLVKADIASMAASLEARSPFLDHEFMELAASLPADAKLRGWRQNKYILKKSLQELLPAHILSRPKQGFVLPIEQWFRDDLKSYLASTLLAKDARLTQTICQPTAIQDLLTRHLQTKTNLAPPLWALLTLELWLRTYFP